MHRFIKAVGAGQKRARDLTREEAREAMTLLISGAVEPVQVGAFLLALRMKGEAADELAGFAEALMAGVARVAALPGALDVDCHGDGHAGRSTLLPAAACALASLGVPVVLRADLDNPYAKHGLRGALDAIGAVPGVTMLDLKSYCAPLAKLVALRPLFGVRTVAQTLMKLLSPAETAARLVGVFHAPYLPSTAAALALISPARSLCVQALGGLPEATPGKMMRAARAGGEGETLDLRFLPAAAPEPEPETEDEGESADAPAPPAVAPETENEGDGAAAPAPPAAGRGPDATLPRAGALTTPTEALAARDNLAALQGREPALSRAVAAGAVMLYAARGTALAEAAAQVREAFASGRARGGYTSR